LAQTFVADGRGLFLQLAADLAAFVGRGVDVDVHVAVHQRLGLGIVERGRALERASGGADRDQHAGIFAFGRRSMEVGRSGRAGEAAIAALPGQFLCSGVVGGGDLATARVPTPP
jgi:hypothetical protein